MFIKGFILGQTKWWSFQPLSADLFRSKELFWEKLNTTLKSAVCAVCK